MEPGRVLERASSTIYSLGVTVPLKSPRNLSGQISQKHYKCRIGKEEEGYPKQHSRYLQPNKKEWLILHRCRRQAWH